VVKTPMTSLNYKKELLMVKTETTSLNRYAMKKLLVVKIHQRT